MDPAFMQISIMWRKIVGWVPRLQQNPVSLYFWTFIVVHTLLWTIGPACLRPSLPHDTLEGITWGLQWQLGYHKHPFLAAWLCAGFTSLFHQVGWPVYFLAQIAVSLTFIAVWYLAKQILQPAAALIATLALEGVFFYNINSFNFTPDTLQSPLWALLALFFFQALTTQRMLFWFACGVFAALSLCTKYQVIILLIPMLLLCMLHPDARKSFRNPGIYVAFVVFLVLITPHLIWLYHHHFITVTYATTLSELYSKNKSWLTHITHPLRFLTNCVIGCLALFLLIWPIYRKSGTVNSARLTSLQKHFLIYIGLGPLILTVLLGVVSGDYFPPRWSTPYFFGLGILMVAYHNTSITPKHIKQYGITLLSFSLVLFAGRMATLSWYPRTSSDSFLPNKTMASVLNKLWREQFHRELSYIAGSNYLVSAVAPYMNQHPIPYLNWDRKESPWIDESHLKESGALFIWDQGQNYTWDQGSWYHTRLPVEVIQRFPNLKLLSNLTFYRLHDHQPIVIGVALLPPSKK